MNNSYLYIKKILILIIAFAIVFFSIQMFFKYKSNSFERKDIIETIEQKILIITSISEDDNFSEMRLLSQQYMSGYSQEIKELCRKQYFFKQNCTLNNLSRDNLIKLNKYLKNAIQHIIKVQKEILK